MISADDTSEYWIYLMVTISLFILVLAMVYLLFEDYWIPRKSWHLKHHESWWKIEMTLLSMGGYLLLWIPGTGIVQHGW